MVCTDFSFLCLFYCPMHIMLVFFYIGGPVNFVVKLGLILTTLLCCANMCHFIVDLFVGRQILRGSLNECKYMKKQ